MVAPTHTNQVAPALPSLGPGSFPQPAAEGKKRSSCTINCLARAAFKGSLQATALVPIEFLEVKVHLS